MKGRRRRQYGPVGNRGLGKGAMKRLALMKAKQKPKKEGPVRGMKYFIPAETECEVRRLNSKADWTPHKTVKPIAPVGFLWRNETHYGFAWSDWEIKVKIGKFRV